MKRKIFIFPVIFLLVTTLFSCDENPEDIRPENNSEIEYKELTADEAKLKTELAEAAQIIAEIASDKEVLNEIVGTIKIQPRVMEDRVKFAELMNSTQKLKSGNVNFKQGIFAEAFNRKLSEGEFKSASTLIDNLNAKGVEVYIPYPIEDYPEGTEIVVTSHPIDNIMENIGYFVESKKTIMATEELSKSNPIIIISTPLFSEEELQGMSTSRSVMEARQLEFQNNRLKSTTTGPVDWMNESVHYGIHIPKIYCTNDHVTGLFGVGLMYITGGTVTFDIGTKLAINNLDLGTIGFALPRKYERYAQEGWYKGWFECDFFIWEDWQPGVISNSLTMCMDVPNVTTNNQTSLSSSFTGKITQKGLEVAMGGNIANSCSTTVTARDVCYGSFRIMRSRYIVDYNSAGVIWGSGQTHIGTFAGDRPALQFSPELKYVTYCEVW